MYTYLVSELFPLHFLLDPVSSFCRNCNSSRGSSSSGSGTWMAALNFEMAIFALKARADPIKKNSRSVLTPPLSKPKMARPLTQIRSYRQAWDQFNLRCSIFHSQISGFRLSLESVELNLSICEDKVLKMQLVLDQCKQL